MTKPKSAPKNFFQYFVDEYILFRRDFYFEIPAQPRFLADKLGSLGYESSSWWRQRRIVSKVTKLEHGWDFAITTEQPFRSSRSGTRVGVDQYTQSAKATGKFYWDKSLTICEGSIVMSHALIPALVIIAALIGISVFQYRLDRPYGTPTAQIVFLSAVFIFTWLSMYRDRNHLYKLIKKAVESTNEISNDKAKA
jgi:hypothetical protein